MLQDPTEFNTGPVCANETILPIFSIFIFLNVLACPLGQKAFLPRSGYTQTLQEGRIDPPLPPLWLTCKQGRGQYGRPSLATGRHEAKMYKITYSQVMVTSLES